MHINIMEEFKYNQSKTDVASAYLNVEQDFKPYYLHNFSKAIGANLV